MACGPAKIQANLTEDLCLSFGNLKCQVFWGITPCGLVSSYRYVDGSWCLYLRVFRSTAWFKTMDSFLYVYISWIIHDIWMFDITFERKDPSFQISSLELSPSAKPCSSVSWEQNGYYVAQDILRSWVHLKLSRRLLCSVRFVFVSTFNLQRGRENLKYRNQLSGACWGAVYSSI